MKKIFLSIITVIIVGLGVILIIQPKNTTQEFSESTEYESHTVDFTGYEIGFLTQDEISALIHMREEEKMARDIYRTLAKTTPVPAFEKIPASEQSHMDVFDQLLDRYGIPDPVVNESEVGQFSDPYFTDLFIELVEKGKQSDKDAFEVGAIVEDLNMSNLIKYGNATDKVDLQLAYNTLFTQSKKHMSSFLQQLDKLGYSYEFQYVSADQAEMSEIN